MPRTRLPVLLLITPYLADANNGNWRTASRWARLLAPHFRVIVQAASDPFRHARSTEAQAMIALHARRSHEAVAAWRDRHADRPLLVTLTGTDLYKDVPARDAHALASIALADRLIVLQDDAPPYVPANARARTQVVFQSARALAPWDGKRDDRLHCVLVAHLREEKDPATAFAAWRLLPHDAVATLTIIGAALDPALGRAARDLASSDPRVRWLGPKPHAWTRQAIKRAHLLVIPSRMEGGANAVVEAVTAGTPVAASRMSGNVGQLGPGYPGYFATGDPRELAAMLLRLESDRGYLASLDAHCRARALCFTPEAEARALLDAINRAQIAARTRMAVPIPTESSS